MKIVKSELGEIKRDVRQSKGLNPDKTILGDKYRESVKSNFADVAFVIFVLSLATAFPILMLMLIPSI